MKMHHLTNSTDGTPYNNKIIIKNNKIRMNQMKKEIKRANGADVKNMQLLLIPS